MRKINQLISIFCLMCFIFSIWQGVYLLNSNKGYTNISEPKLWSSSLTNEQIIYDSSVERFFGTWHVTVDLTIDEIHLDAVEVNVTLTFNNGTVQNLTLQENEDIWSGQYNPDANAPVGVNRFNVTVFDGLSFIYSSNYDFIILNSLPKVEITLNTTELYRGQTLQYNVTPTDAEDPLYLLTWTSAICKASNHVEMGGSNVSNLLTTSYNGFGKTFPNDQLGQYYVQARVIDKEGNSTTVRKYFNVYDNIPQIDEMVLEFSDSEYTNPSNKEVLRGSGTLKFTINVTDVEKTTTTYPRLKVYTISNKNNSIDFGIFEPIEANPVDDYQFSSTLTIPAFMDVGVNYIYFVLYDITFTISRNNTSYQSFTVFNNIPNASKIDFTINNKRTSSGGLIIEEFEEIAFWVNLTNCDVEGLTLVKICLLDKDNKWTNFTFSYTANTLNYSIRAKDLKAGQWIVYISVVDSDGAQVQTATPMAFDIKIDWFSRFLPYLMLLIGIGAGVGLIAAIFGPRYLRYQRLLEEQKTTTTLQKESIIGSGKTARRRKQLEQQNISKKADKKMMYNQDQEDNVEEESEEDNEGEETQQQEPKPTKKLIRKITEKK